MKPLRILHTESSTGWGGQEIRILTEAQGMLARGHQIALLTPPDAEIYPAAQKLAIPVIALPINRKQTKPMFDLRRWLAKHGRDFDIINTHSSTDTWLTAIASATLGGMPPMVRTRHVSTPINDHFSTRWLYLRATAHIVITGEALRQQLHEKNGYPLDHITSVPTGIDLKRFQPQPQAEARAKLGLLDRPTLGILATLRDWKGHDYLLEAFARLRADFPDWHLLIIGDGPWRPRLDERLRHLDLTACVTFAGNQDDVPAWLNALDLFALPSFGDEGVPQSIMQAMACGLPVVSTPVGGIPEAVRNEETGLLVPPKDAASLAASLARLMRDDALRLRMGRSGRQRALDHFGIDIMLDRMESVFNRYRKHS